jgi:hypothetical protein
MRAAHTEFVLIYTHVLLVCYLIQSVITPAKGSATATTAVVSSGARGSSATSRIGGNTLAFAFGQRVAIDTTP